MIDLAEGDPPLFIDYKDGPFGNSGKRIAGAQDTITPSYLGMWKEVAAQRKM